MTEPGLFTLRLDVLLAILGMAAATYACRAGGYVVLRGRRPPRFVQAMLQHLPGCIFVAFILPGVVAQGPLHLAGAAAAVLCMALTRMLTLSIIVGVGTLWALVALLPA
ncbi:AzlD family protein [Rhodovarius crocodyli]|uniref:AzlD family protein n=1 Tax=Rhodovarius crocodyli TaxID=1979269 RepID=UPI001F0C1E64|nr:AzlD domain-containing protein [Rhodovarius crocodyli]